jgi:hypothetical protein
LSPEMPTSRGQFKFFFGQFLNFSFQLTNNEY